MDDGKLQSIKMPSTIRRQSKIGSRQKSANIFEKNFFAELIEREEKEMQKGIIQERENKPMDDDFFEEHFARKGDYSSKQKLIKREKKMLMNNVKGINQKTEAIINQRKDVIGEKRELLGKRSGPIGQKRLKDDFFNQHFARKEDYSSKQKLIEMVGEDEFELLEDEKKPQGLKKLWKQIEPVWKWNQEELVEFMAKRVIYETDDLIALNKPFQMALCNAPPDQPQLDRILSALKDRIVPGKRLHVVTRLDKSASGVIIFAKNKEKKDELKTLFEQDHFYFRYRCLCRNFLKETKTRINIPLIKVLKDGNVKFCPLIGEANSTEQLYRYNTDCKLVNENRRAMVSLIDVFTRRGMCNLVRSHLYYGLDCPVIGDEKYARSGKPGQLILKKAIHSEAMAALEMRKNDIRKLPMFIHLAEIHVPQRRHSTNETFMDYTVIKAAMPNYFVYALKKLSLLSKLK